MNARDRLAAIAARADAATEGPWIVKHEPAWEADDVQHPDVITVGAQMWEGDDEPMTVCLASTDYEDDPVDVLLDAEFIAHARADVPALVAFATAVLDELHTPFTADFAGVGARTYCVQCTEDSGYTAYPCAHVEAINRLADEHLGGTS